MEENNKNKNPKAQKLMEKCDKLIKKLEEEQSSMKKGIYTIRLKMLIAKFQKEIDLNNVREEYSNERQEREEGATEHKIDNRSEIISLNKQIKDLEKELKKDKEYDYSSDQFIFPKEEVEKEGGIEKYIDNLTNSGRFEQIEVAEKMSESLESRKELDSLKKELQNKQNELKNVDKNVKSENRKSKVKETALVVKEKTNIFSKIKSFFSNVKNTVQERANDKREIKDVRKEGQELIKDVRELGNTGKEKLLKDKEAAIKAIEEEYKQNIADLEEREKEVVDNIDILYQEEVQGKKKESKEEHINDFKQQIVELAKKGNLEASSNKENSEELEAKDTSEDFIFDSDDDAR